jgi:hypothetical protein
LSTFLPHLLAAGQSDDPFVRQPALYGIGVCAEHGGPSFDSVVPSAVQILTGAVNAPGSRKGANASATDNAVSSLIKMARFRASSPGVDVEGIMKFALAYLPLKDDPVEARIIHKQLVGGLAASDPLWVGPAYARLADAIGALARALIAHKENTGEVGDAAAAAAAAAGTLQEAAGGDDDEEEGEEDAELFDDSTLTQLKAILGALRVSPAAAAVGGIVGTLKKKQQAALAEFGLALS